MTFIFYFILSISLPLHYLFFRDAFKIRLKSHFHTPRENHLQTVVISIISPSLPQALAYHNNYTAGLPVKHLREGILEVGGAARISTVIWNWYVYVSVLPTSQARIGVGASGFRERRGNSVLVFMNYVDCSECVRVFLDTVSESFSWDQVNLVCILHHTISTSSFLRSAMKKG